MAYTSQPYAESMAMHPAVSYIPYATSSREQTDNMQMLLYCQFVHLRSEMQNLLSETHDDRKVGNKSDEDSIIPQLISEE